MKYLNQKKRQLLLAITIILIFSFKINAQPPLFDQWESNMTEWGNHWGVYLQTYDPPTNGGMNEQEGTYYDGQRVFFQIADYTGQAEPWNAHAQEAERVYRAYLDNRTNNNGTIPWFVQGYRRFSHGIMMDADRTDDPSSVEGVLRMRDNGSYANVLITSYREVWHHERRSREIAYMISAHVNAEKFGLPRQEEALAHYVTMAMKHFDEWITETYANTENHRLSPFMVALASEALIEFYEWEAANERDPQALFTHPAVAYNPTRTITEAIQQIAYNMRYTSTVESGANAGKPMWVEDMGGTNNNWDDTGGTGYSTLRYESIKNARPTPVLNLLICPLYAWVFKQTGEEDYINIGDKLWESGMALSNVGWNTKIFNQNYRWSFDYIKWRNEGMVLSVAGIKDANKISTYPNPVKNVLTINALEQPIESYKIYTINGQVIQSDSLVTKNQVNTSSLTPGVYLLEFIANQKTVIIKFIKE
ncbi:MAG: T9SS type A sorting domain-containing protein [Cyclobacteriaceae bacterium]|nr:T9SS type A sorting domain-containing protein [Cyclobacteriaceae bacterium]